MRTVALCLSWSTLALFAVAQTSRKPEPANSTQSSALGNCSVANVGNGNTIEIKNCGIGKEQTAKIVSLLKEALADRNLPEINAKLDELLNAASRSSLEFVGTSVLPKRGPAAQGSNTVIALGFWVVGNSPIHDVENNLTFITVKGQNIYPRMWAKFYRVFLSGTQKHTDNSGVPEIGPQEVFGINTAVNWNGKIDDSASSYIFAKITWKDAQGDPSETTRCESTEGAPTNSSDWHFCSVPLAAARELRYESMTTSQLIEATYAMSVTIRDRAYKDDRENSQLQGSCSKYIAVPGDYDRCFEKEVERRERTHTQQMERVGTTICPELESLVEEDLFRIDFYMKRETKPQDDSVYRNAEWCAERGKGMNGWELFEASRSLEALAMELDEQFSFLDELGIWPKSNAEPQIPPVVLRGLTNTELKAQAMEMVQKLRAIDDQYRRSESAPLEGVSGPVSIRDSSAAAWTQQEAQWQPLQMQCRALLNEVRSRLPAGLIPVNAPNQREPAEFILNSDMLAGAFPLRSVSDYIEHLAMLLPEGTPRAQ